MKYSAPCHFKLNVILKHCKFMKNKLLFQLAMVSKHVFYGIVVQCFFAGMLIASNLEAQRIATVKEVFVNLEMERASVSEIFSAIEKATDFRFSYYQDEIDLNHKVDNLKGRRSVNDILLAVSKEASLKFRQVNHSINVSVLKRNNSKKNDEIEIIIDGITITGRVTSQEDGEGLPGVNVVEKGTRNGTVTNVQGNYLLQVSEGATLVFSSVGYTRKEVEVGNQTVINVSLVPDIKALEEIVVVGYGTMKKSDLTGSVVSVKGDAIRNSTSPTFDQALQGRAAGVQVMTNSGQPGAATTVRVRGTNSILGNNEPLYVIDGIQVTQGENETVFFVGNGGNRGAYRTSPLANLNPADIESIEILKDASATAIYGNRGANGVVLVTTKKGKKGEAKIDYEYSEGFKTLAKKVDVMNLQDYARFNNEQALVQGKTPRPEFANPASLTGGTDWQDAIFETGRVSNHNLSISGGSDNLNYYVSGNYNTDKGPVLNSWMDRAAFRANVAGKVKNWANFGNNLTFGQSKTKYVMSNSVDSPIFLSLLKAPDIDIYDENGDFIGVKPGQDVAGGGIFQANPIALTKDRDSRKNKFNVYNNLYVDLVYKDLTLKTEFNVLADFTNDYAYYSKAKYAGFENNTSLLNEANSMQTGYEFRNILSYIRQFGDHSINTMAAHEVREGRGYVVSGAGGGFYNNNLNSLNLTDQTFASTGGNRYRYRSESYLARAFYNYKDFAMATASIRADGSPNFPADNRWGYFPSFSAALRLSNLEFFKAITLIDELKINGGWGQVGNSNTLGGQFRPLVGITPLPDGGYSTSFLNYDTKLRWEATESTNLGVEVGVLKNRVTLLVEAYNKKTIDALNQVSLPSSVGSGVYIVSNIASIQNKGLEITLNTVNSTGGLKWNTDLQFTLNRNKILSIGEGGVPIYRGFSKNDEGGPIGRFWGYKTDGLYQNFDDLIMNARWKGVNSVDPTVGMWIGDYKFVDINPTDGNADWEIKGYTASYDEAGNYIPGSAVYTGVTTDKIVVKNASIINEEDQTYIGNPNPKFSFGFNNSFKFSNFDLNIYLYGVYGNDIYNQTKQQMILDHHYNRNVLATMKDRAVPVLKQGGDAANILDYALQNPDAVVPRLRGGTNFGWAAASNRWIEDGSFLRVKNVVLGYTLPNALASKVGATKLRGYVNAQNLLTFTKYSGWDPEVGSIAQSSLVTGVDIGNYPISRIFTLGVQVGF
jgi:TonB-dependent starch-binding outer membrane protein SusC